jgi:group I intron endonuclease
MYYTIYCTTNLVNGKKYIGKHVTRDIYDDYLGSGLQLQAAIKKYGRSSFRKDVLHIYETEELMNTKEAELVNEAVIASDEYYNIAMGGHGGQIVLKDGHPLYHSTRKKLKEAALKRAPELSARAKERHARKDNIGMYGRTHTERAKARIGAAHTGKHVSAETRQKLSESHKGKEPSNKGKSLEESVGAARARTIKQALSNRNKVKYVGRGNPMYGKKHSLSTKEQLSEKAKNREKHACVHCGKMMPLSTLNRWHNDNCKSRTPRANS